MMDRDPAMSELVKDTHTHWTGFEKLSWIQSGCSTKSESRSKKCQINRIRNRVNGNMVEF